jgi:hypothetical protein
LLYQLSYVGETERAIIPARWIDNKRGKSRHAPLRSASAV